MDTLLHLRHLQRVLAIAAAPGAALEGQAAGGVAAVPTPRTCRTGTDVSPRNQTTCRNPAPDNGQLSYGAHSALT